MSIKLWHAIACLARVGCMLHMPTSVRGVRDRFGRTVRVVKESVRPAADAGKVDRCAS